MLRTRLFHLLIVAALLCSQMASAAHIAGHLHDGGYAGTTGHDHEHARGDVHDLRHDHDAQHEQVPSCVVYHIHAGAHFLQPAILAVQVDDRAEPHYFSSLPLVWVTLKPDLHTIRGPPVIS